MKATGMVRKIDELGRIVLPIEIRKNLGISIKDPLEIFISNDKIVLKKYAPADIFTGEMDNLIEYHGKKVSKNSIIEMAKLAGLEINNKNSNIDLDSSEFDIDEYNF